MRVITEHGLSQSITAEDGIDQGECISPLLWQIFYDPLLSRIHNDPDLGYTITTVRDLEINSGHHRLDTTKLATLAYADDTIWLANSKHNLMKILDIADQFYTLNDIKINDKKSELVCINCNTGKRSKPHIVMGKQAVKI